MFEWWRFHNVLLCLDSTFDTGGLLFEQLLLLGAKFAGLQQAGSMQRFIQLEVIESTLHESRIVSSPFKDKSSHIRIAMSVLAETNPIF